MEEKFALDNSYHPKRKKLPFCGNNPNKLQRRLIDDYDWEPTQKDMFPGPPASRRTYCECCGTSLGLESFCPHCHTGKCKAGDQCAAPGGATNVCNLPSPLAKKIRDAKQSCGDALLLFRMGDFYELFFEDAKIAARTLGLTLTTRDKNGAEPVSMAGFPYHQLENYLQKLVASGHRVAVCEQQ